MRAIHLIEGLMTKKQSLQESTNYEIRGGRTFEELAKLDLARDGAVLILRLEGPPPRKEKAYREAYRQAELDSAATGLPVDIEQVKEGARLKKVEPGEAMVKLSDQEYAVTDGKDVLWVDFSGGVVCSADRYGASYVENLLAFAGDEAVDEHDDDYLSGCEDDEE